MNKAALITGASSGIGFETAGLLAAGGYNLILVARSKELSEIAEDLATKYGVKVEAISLDLSKLGAAKTLWDKVEKFKPEVFINNAGFGDLKKLVEADPDKLESMILLNVLTMTQLAHYVSKQMVEEGRGKIMNLASIASFIPGPGMATYYATKAFVLSFTEGVAHELKGTGVSMTALCPGPTRSGFQEAAAMQDSKIVKDKKLPTSREVAEFGLDAMFAGKVIAVHGLSNKVLALVVPRLLPRSLVATLVDKAQN
jgi:uncharacterized protein